MDTEAEGPPRTDGQEITGTIKVWLVEKGYGFVSCDDEGPDLFVHNSVLDVEGDAAYRAAVAGTPVVCTYILKNDKHTASKCTGTIGALLGYSSREEAERKMEVATAVAAAEASGMVTGTIKFIVKEKGFGFIIPDVEGDDIFVHIGDIMDQLVLEKGEPVSYTTEIRKGNKPQAVKVIPLRPQPQVQGGTGPQALDHIHGERYGFVAPPHHGAHHVMDHGLGAHALGPPRFMGFGYEQPQAPPAHYPAMAPLGNGMRRGSIKFMMEEKGFGFIVPEDGGDDLFVHLLDIENQEMMPKGEAVQYSVTLKPGGKRPQAVSVSRLRQASQGAYPGLSALPPAIQMHSYAAGGPPPVPQNYNAQPRYYEPQPHQPQYAFADPGPAYGDIGGGGGGGGGSGTVKFFDETKGYGFIIPVEGGGDLYFKSTDLVTQGTPMVQGEPVTYETKFAGGKKWAVQIVKGKGTKRKVDQASPEFFKRSATYTEHSQPGSSMYPPQGGQYHPQDQYAPQSPQMQAPAFYNPYSL